MRKHVMLLCLLIMCSSVFSQPAASYQELKNKSNKLYEIKDFGNAALAWNEAFALPGAKPALADHWSAACSWSLSDHKDSAFAHLAMTLQYPDLTFFDVDDMMMDGDFIPLHRDPRWESIKSKLFSRLEQLISAQQLTYVNNKIMGGTGFKPSFEDPRWNMIFSKMYLNIFEGFKKELLAANIQVKFSESQKQAYANAFINNPDSAFAHLNDEAFILLGKKEAKQAYSYLETSNRYFPEIYWLVNDLGSYFAQTGEKEKAFDYLSQALNMKYHVPSIAAVTPDIESALTADYLQLMKRTGISIPSRPKNILIDESHFEFHTLTGSFTYLAGLLRKEGFNLSANKIPITPAILKNTNLLIISNAGVADIMSLQKKANEIGEPMRWARTSIGSAFSENEITAIKDWVQQGGSLFLIIDHAPNGANAASLAAAFGIDLRNVETRDSTHRDFSITTNNRILYTRKDKMIGQHPIMEGIDSIVTYKGGSISGPKSSTSLLQLSNDAIDRDWQPEIKNYRFRSAAGRNQGLAMAFGKGRIVVSGEAGMFTAAPGTDSFTLGTEGLGRKDGNNLRYAMNIIKWLAR